MRSLSGLLALASLLVVNACTMKSQEAPPLAGPSEFGTSITIAVTPDVLTQDGASQSSIIITARDANGQPIRGLSLRLDMGVNGELMDFGSLSSRSLVTGNDGRATAVYTAPAAPALSADAGTIVTFFVTPVGSDFGNATARSATLRLAPPGVILPIDGLSPNFVAPTGTDNTPILFRSTSTSAGNNPIVSWRWDFGDGSSASGEEVVHIFSSAGSFTVRLTITDGYGRSATVARVVTIAEGARPVARFTVSPAGAVAGAPLFFNASESTAAAGRRIVSYAWDFGDGTAAGSGMQISHTFAAIGKYKVTLVITDDADRKGTIAVDVDVK